MAASDHLSPQQFPTHLSIHQFPRAWDGGGRVEAHLGDARIGYLEHAPDGFIENVEVSPAHRRQGVATALAQRVRDTVGTISLPNEEDLDTNTHAGLAWVRAMNQGSS